MLTTSFFASKAPKEHKVCIAKWNRFWTGPRAVKFAPSNPNARDWQDAFRRDLDARFPEPEALRAYLKEIAASDPDAILCCYEHNPEDCHRRVLAAYVKEKLGMDIPEWQPPMRQMSLI